MHKKILKKFFLFETIASELVALNCLYSEEDTCHRHSVCQERILRFLHVTNRDFFQVNCVHSDQ